MEDKRRDARYKRQYIIMYSVKSDPSHKSFEVSGLHDISKGGLKFSSYENYPVGTAIEFHIKFPFNYPNATEVEGRVVGVHQLPNVKSYKISVTFSSLDHAAIASLEEMEKINQKSKQ